ncbi:MAG: UDP-2,3-diacylglucosamine diphosphatase [Roseivirga sp.]
MKLQLKPGKKVYFASDFHLGVPNAEVSLKREKKIVRWLDDCSKDASAIFLVGDLFDFWFEYKTTIPKGYSRFFGKLAEISDAGIDLIIFTGNHDMWMYGYFEKEFNAKVIYDPIQLFINDTKIYIGHGDGLGPGDKGYKFLKKIFRNPFFQWCFHWLHPNIGVGVADYWSRRSRAQANDTEQVFLGDDEWLWNYSRETEAQEHHDAYIFGHRHLPLDLEVGQNSRYLNLGEWFSAYTYVAFDGTDFSLKTFEA